MTYSSSIVSQQPYRGFSSSIRELAKRYRQPKGYLIDQKEGAGR